MSKTLTTDELRRLLELPSGEVEWWPEAPAGLEGKP